jgi:hypothetical protein
MNGFKSRILETILANDLFVKHLVSYDIEIEYSNFASKDNKAILSEDNKVFLGKDTEIPVDNTYFVSKYTTEEIEETLTDIDEYQLEKV